ncbi:ATP-binding protein [bacterium]|nr:ATP-binding protein [bacterium]
MKKISIDIYSHLDYVRYATVSVKSMLQFHTTNLDVLYHFELALTEAITNVIKHSYDNNDGFLITLNVTIKSNYIQVDVIDYATPYSLPLNKEFEFSPYDIEALPEGGMGIHLMKECLDELSFENKDGYNMLSLIKMF